MTKIRKTVLVALLTLAFVVVASLRMFGLASSCPPSAMIRLTGTLVEVRQDGTALPSSDPIFTVVPPCVRLEPLSYSPGEHGVEVRDCYDSQVQVTFSMVSP